MKGVMDAWETIKLLSEDELFDNKVKKCEK